MDTKVTLRFDASVIENAKACAESQGLSLSRLIELLLKKIHDFEEGLQYYAAWHAGCNCIVTENVKDFYFSEAEVLTARNFLLKYYRNT